MRWTPCAAPSSISTSSIQSSARSCWWSWPSCFSRLRCATSTRCDNFSPPLVGRGQGWGWCEMHHRCPAHHPPPQPSPTRGEGEEIPAMRFIPAKVRNVLAYVLIFGLLAGVYALPPDTSLAEVRKSGLLRVCMPPSYPPLVTGNPQAPGIDVELVSALAKKLGLRLVVSLNQAMGVDFNPRNWRVTRAQCEILAGGVVASPVTKSFL